jgi:hypothetical protein
MNPARSLAPALVSGVLNNLWLYWSATFIGTSIVALILRGVFVSRRASSCSLSYDVSSSDKGAVKVSSTADFFYDDPTMPYAPIPEHDIDQSPAIR